MEIKMTKLPIRELIKSYSEDETTSRVQGWDGNLDIRPEYQREFVYDDKKRDSVINTILKGFPLNIMYFVDRKDGTYEVLDGQQRIISICRYATNKYSVKIPDAKGGYNFVNFPNLFDEQVEKFLNYELQVYLCEGTEKEKLEWFQIINIAGEMLEKQEIRNAIYHSAWLTDAKSAFSRRNCAAHKNYGKYFAGEYIRQKYLETAILWATDLEGLTEKDPISQYMQIHRKSSNADHMWKYIEDVFNWVETSFGKYDKTMKGLKWGIFYNKHKDDKLDPKSIQNNVSKLMADKEVTKKSGIYEYILTGEDKFLSLRKFDNDERVTIYNQQKGICSLCEKPYKITEMHADHIIPWSKGGKTELDNCQMLCITCNLKKSNK